MRWLRPWSYLVLVALLFFLGDRGLAYLLGEITSRGQFRFDELYRGGLRHDVLVVGDSRAVHSVFAPELSDRLCLSVFNMAYNGMSTEIAVALVEDYLAHNAPPKAVLIEISNTNFHNELLNDLRLYADRSRNIADLIRRDDPAMMRWLRLSHLYAFNNEMLLRSLYYLSRSDQDWILSSGAHLEPALMAKLRADWYLPPESFAPNVAAMKRLIAELRARHIEPILYIAPYHPLYRRFFPRYPEWVQNLQAELGEDILDLSVALTDNDDFADVQHVNLNGSRAIMNRLAAEVEAQIPVQRTSQCPVGNTKAAALP